MEKPEEPRAWKTLTLLEIQARLDSIGYEIFRLEFQADFSPAREIPEGVPVCQKCRRPQHTTIPVAGGCDLVICPEAPRDSVIGIPSWSSWSCGCCRCARRMEKIEIVRV